MEPIVREALCHVSARQDVVIRLNPDDHAQCKMAHQGDEGAMAGEIRFLSDPAIPRAECIVETPEGMVESSPKLHLEDISEILRIPE